MAGIEKCCELTGDGCGWEMCGWKRNHIQVKPSCRKLFKNAEHEFYIESISYRIKHKFGWYYDDDGRELELGERRVKEYTFVLKVFDENLLGEVNGEYLNWTTDVTTTKRKLKKMLGGKLNVVKKPFPEHYALNGERVTKLPCGKVVGFYTGKEI